ncbi:hypothetical protein LNV09_14470 [Paucibacter sp. B2R-40]|uniref:hypothetical protein n=1 Tax=Paucibacter sp. B2R-40 TaxID=2893554 RepID=UPI0021E44301|nr:hypothetical protein [Paucibacter sp. B2R-40]MCV2355355.1 hypothetical protein [Paucibacter sp. B2R-40]
MLSDVCFEFLCEVERTGVDQVMYEQLGSDVRYYAKAPFKYAHEVTDVLQRALAAAVREEKYESGELKEPARTGRGVKNQRIIFPQVVMLVCETLRCYDSDVTEVELLKRYKEIWPQGTQQLSV